MCCILLTNLTQVTSLSKMLVFVLLFTYFFIINNFKRKERLAKETFMLIKLHAVYTVQ